MIRRFVFHSPCYICIFGAGCCKNKSRMKTERDRFSNANTHNIKNLTICTFQHLLSVCIFAISNLHIILLVCAHFSSFRKTDSANIYHHFLCISSGESTTTKNHLFVCIKKEFFVFFIFYSSIRSFVRWFVCLSVCSFLQTGIYCKFKAQQN